MACVKIKWVSVMGNVRILVQISMVDLKLLGNSNLEGRKMLRVLGVEGGWVSGLLLPRVDALVSCELVRPG